MANLYTTGCSYTHGHSHYIEANDLDWVWSNRLAVHYSSHVNEAWHGGSNHRSVRRAVNHIANLDSVKDLVVVWQFTNLNRFEYFDSKYNIPVGIINEMVMLDDQNYNNPAIDFKDLEIRSRIPSAYRSLYVSDTNAVVEFFSMVTMFSKYLADQKIKHLFVPMSEGCSPLHISKTNLDPVVRDLYNVLPHSNILTTPMTHMYDSTDREDPPKDNHPNKHGHKKIYTYIHNELINRGYL